jgi:hypothetical protein
MHYQNGIQKLIEGQPHFWDSERNGWVNPNNGFVLSEQQLQEMDFMMHSEDGYNLPNDVVHFITTSGRGTIALPAKPRRGFRDYNRIEIEIQAPGGSGGDVTQANNRAAQPKGTSAGGGGAGGYGRLVYNFNRNIDVSATSPNSGTTFTYEIPADWNNPWGVTFIAESIAGDVVLRIFPGQAGNTHTVGAGGTAHFSTNPSAVHFKELVALVGGTGSAGGFINGSTQGGVGGLPIAPKSVGWYDRQQRSGAAGSQSASALGVTSGAVRSTNAAFMGAGGGGGCTTDANNTQAYNDTLGLTFGGELGGPFVKVVFYTDDAAGKTGV